MAEKIDLLIESRWIAPVEPDCLLSHHAVAVRGGTIVAILPTSEARKRYVADETVQLAEHILIPGLINLHTHAAMTLLRGLADDLPLMDWLQRRIWPAEARHVSPAFVRDGTLLAGTEMLRGGVTCFNDMYFHPGAAAEAAASLGMRAVLGITTLDVPTAYASDAADYIRKGLATRDQWLNHPLISFCLAPHAPYTVSDATFERLLTLAEQLDLPIHCHIHETRDEIAQSLAAHGCRPLERLHRLGLLGPHFIGVHGVHLDEGEIELLAGLGCALAHCPTSNLKLASGIAPVAAMVRKGLRVGLGTDGAASNNRLDVLQEMRLAALLAKGSSGDATILGAHGVLRMATLDSAAALGLDQRIGSLVPGKAADLAAFDLGALETTPCFDPVSHLLYVIGREQVSDVWIDGKRCFQHSRRPFRHENELKNSVALWQNKMIASPAE